MKTRFAAKEGERRRASEVEGAGDGFDESLVDARSVSPPCRSERLFRLRGTPREGRRGHGLLFGDDEEEGMYGGEAGKEAEVTPPSNRMDSPLSPPSAFASPPAASSAVDGGGDEDMSSWLHKANPSTARPTRIRRTNSIFTNKLLLTAPKPRMAHGGSARRDGDAPRRFAATTTGVGRRASSTDLTGHFEKLRLTPEATGGGRESPPSTSSSDETSGARSSRRQAPFSFRTHFTCIDTIGEGAFSDVYRVQSKDDGEYYAVKKLKQPFVSKADREAKMQEMKMFLSLNEEDEEGSHHIIRYIAAWQEEGHLHVQMELCERGNLDDFVCSLEHCDVVPEPTVWNWVGQLAAALKCLHGAKMVHLDLKPQNIFLTQSGELRLGDLGMTVRAGADDDVEGDVRFMAPECMNARHKSAAMDIYSLGISAYEISSKSQCRAPAAARRGPVAAQSSGMPKVDSVEALSILGDDTAALAASPAGSRCISPEFMMPVGCVHRTAVNDAHACTHALAPCTLSLTIPSARALSDMHRRQHSPAASLLTRGARVRKARIATTARRRKRRRRWRTRLARRAQVSVLLFTVTYYANLAHSLTRSP